MERERQTTLSESDPRVAAALRRPLRPCELCGGRSRRRVYRKNALDIVRCGACGLCYVPHPFTPDELNSFYQEDYYEGGVYPSYASAEVVKRGVFRDTVRRLERMLPRQARILDVGAAYGYFVAEARAAGHDAVGLEPSEAAVTRAKAAGIPVHSGTLEGADFPAESFDGVTFLDAIEHLDHPRAAIEATFDLLRPGGIVAMSTANIRSLAARIYRDRWSIVLPPWHLFYFDPATVTRLLTDAGFGDVRVDCATGLLFESHWDLSRARYRLASKAWGNRYARRIANRTQLGYLMFVTAQKPGRA